MGRRRATQSAAVTLTGVHLKVAGTPADLLVMARSCLRCDDGGIVVGWLLKLTFTLLVLGVLLYDGVSIAYTKVTTSDDARYIALGASEAIVLQRADEEQATQAAIDRADSRGVMLGEKDIVIDDDGSVRVRVRRTANTLVAYRIGALDRFTRTDETYTTPPLR